MFFYHYFYYGSAITGLLWLSIITAAASELRQLPLVSRRVLEERRSSSSRGLVEAGGGGAQVAALYQGLHEHYVDLYCGTPPQRQTVIVSTGARDTVFPCSHCQEDCGISHHTDPSFQEGNSMTFSELSSCEDCISGTCQEDDDDKHKTCAMGVRYRDGSSWAATEVRDVCYLGGLHDQPVNGHTNADSTESGKRSSSPLDPKHAATLAFTMNFGCQTKVTGSFQRQLADGTLSMANTPNSFWRQMVRAQKMDTQAFSLCYSRSAKAERTGSESGVITLGGTDIRLHSTTMVYAAMQDDNGDFGVRFRKVHLRQGGGGDSVQASRDDLKIRTLDISEERLMKEPITIESGYSMTHVSSELAQPFRIAWWEITGENFQHQPLYLTHDQIQELPTILLQMEGIDPNPAPGAVGLAGDLDPDHPNDVVIAMSPNHYMEYDKEKGAYVPRFTLDKRPPDRSILGANTIMGHDVFIDVDNHRIGWAESHCDYANLIDDSAHAKRPYHPSYAANEETCSLFCQAWIFLLIFIAATSIYTFRGKFPVTRHLVRSASTGGGYQLAPDEFGGPELELQETATRSAQSEQFA